MSILNEGKDQKLAERWKNRRENLSTQPPAKPDDSGGQISDETLNALIVSFPIHFNNKISPERIKYTTLALKELQHLRASHSALEARVAKYREALEEIDNDSMFDELKIKNPQEIAQAALKEEEK